MAIEVDKGKGPATSREREPPKLRVVTGNRSIGPDQLTDEARPAWQRPAAKNIYSSIGKCVAHCREKRGISQRELAFALSMKLALLKKCEGGEAVFTPDLLLKAAQFLEVKVANFFVILAEKRLADLSSFKLNIDQTFSVVADADKIRLALSDAIDRCDSLATILDIITTSQNL